MLRKPKKLYKLIYLLLMLCIFIVTSYGFIKKVVISKKLKNILVYNLQPILKVDEFDIKNIKMGIFNIDIENIIASKNGNRINCDRVRLKYSIFNLLKYGLNLKEYVEQVSIKGIDISLSSKSKTPPDSLKGKLPNNLTINFDRYKYILDKAKKYNYLNIIKVEDINLSIGSHPSLNIFTGLHGEINIKEYNRLRLNLRGYFLDNKEENLQIQGLLDYNYYSGFIDINIKESYLKERAFPDANISLNSGFYNGGIQVKINQNKKGSIDLRGSLNLNNLSGHYGELEIDSVNSILSFYNGSLFLNSFKGYIFNSKVFADGSLEDIFNPKLELYLACEDIDKRDLKLLEKRIFKQKDSSLRFKDKNSLYLSFKGDRDDFKLELAGNIPFLGYNNLNFRNTSFTGKLKDEQFILQNFKTQYQDNIINLQGKYNISGYDVNDFQFQFKHKGSLFKSIPNLKNLQIFNNFVKTKGHFTKKQGIITLDGDLSIFESSLMTNQLAKTSFRVLDKKVTLTVKKEDKKLLSGFLDFSNLSYQFNSFSPKDLYSCVMGSNHIEIFDFEEAHILGNNGRGQIQLESPHKSAMIGFTLSNDSLKGNFYVKYKNMYVNSLIKNDFTYYNNHLSFYNISIFNKQLQGDISLDLLTNRIKGGIDLQLLSLNRLFPIITQGKLSGKLSVDGYLDNLGLIATLNIKDLSINNREKFSVTMSSHSDKNRFIVDRLQFFNSINKLLDMTGYYEDGYISLSSYGHVLITELKEYFLGKIMDNFPNLDGMFHYSLDVAGKINSLNVKRGIIRIEQLKGFKENIENIDINFSSDNCLLDTIDIDNIKIYDEGGINIEASGKVFPSLRGKLSLKGSFYGDLLIYLGRYIDEIQSIGSNCEGSFAVKGTIKKPKLSELSIYFSDGYLKMPLYVENLFDLRGKVYINDAGRLVFQDFRFEGERSRGEIYIQSLFGDPYGIGEMKLPLGVYALPIGVYMPDGAMDIRIPGMMKKNQFGELFLTGKKDRYFKLGRKNNLFILRGKVITEQTLFTYPFMNSTGGDSDYPLALDLVIIPGKKTRYFYQEDPDEGGSFWKNFTKSLFQLDYNISNLNVNVRPDREGLSIWGSLDRYGKINLKGELSVVGGKLDYAAFSFDIDNLKISFDGIRNKNGDIDPYLEGEGYTTVRSKNDIGIPSFSDIILKIVTKDENNQIIDNNGARFSKLAIELYDDSGQQLLMKGKDNKLYNMVENEEALRSIISQNLDSRLFSPLLHKIEDKLEQFLGAFVSIRPRVTNNLDRLEMATNMPNPSYDLANIFKGSEMYISKFMTKDLALTYHLRYIGTGEFITVMDRHGYRNNLSLDYRIGRHLFSSVGYEYNTLTRERGYNLSLIFRKQLNSFMDVYTWYRDLYWKLTK